MTNDQTFSHDAGSALGAVTAAAALAGVLLWALQCVSRTHRSRVQTHEVPERLQTWEGEGGRPSEVGTVTPPTSP